MEAYRGTEEGFDLRKKEKKKKKGSKTIYRVDRPAALCQKWI